jgi:peptide deformylase
MAVKKINTTSTPEGLKILTTPCLPILDMSLDFSSFINDLVDTAVAHRGCIGLSANQIWDNPNMPAPAIFIVPGSAIGSWAVCINPTMDVAWKKMIKSPESCMSVPGVSVQCERHRHICVSYYDAEKTWQQSIHMFDFPAKIFQHEMDHIRGELIDA